MDNQIDPTTGTSRFKAVFDNSDSALFPNQFVNCRLLIDTIRGAVVVPSAAIQRGPQGTYLYAVKPGGTVSFRVVALGAAEGSDVVVKEGVRGGESVVVDGQDKLQDGTRVDARAPLRVPASRPAA